ncbi:TetR/AcrR family transcriptional regulator [Mycolicibacterium palauense]|uniref:TetR/AcrR family transcriptional regulator n=1 Tax=Mycolicibacterium palauense TaxID=2034511 RepID=UPI000BFEAAFF|nr:TetR/AcrR family transcriptional regulator [Mycolicibacterium palauense]
MGSPGVDVPRPAGADPFRERLLDGLAESIAERGYRDTTVADIVRHAKTSKRTFYAHFAGKNECLLDLLDIENARMVEAIRAAVDPHGHWHTQIEQAIDSYVRTVAARPTIWLTWIREFPALGDAARPTQRRETQRLIDMLMDLTRSPGFREAGLPGITRPLALILLGGLRELTAYSLEDGEDIRGIADTAVAACAALVSRGYPGAHQQARERA